MWVRTEVENVEVGRGEAMGSGNPGVLAPFLQAGIVGVPLLLVFATLRAPVDFQLWVIEG